MDRDSSLSPNHYHPNPFLQNQPFQHRTSQNHVFYNTAIQNRFAENPRVVETHGLFSPRNLHHYQSSGSDWLNSVEDSPGVEGLESAMSRLRLSNLNRNTASIGLYSGPNGFGNNFFMDKDSYEKQFLLRSLRIDAAARLQLERHRATLRLQDLLSDPNRSNFSTINSHMPNGNRVGSDDHYGFMMDRSKSFSSLLSDEQLLWTPQHHNFSSLEDVRGQVVSVAKDQRGCRFLQMKIDEGKPEEIEIILSEVKDHLHELMIDHFGNYLIQKIFEASSVSLDQMTSILFLVIRNEQKLKDLCIDNHGTRAMQKLLENLKTPEQISAAIIAVRNITVTLTKNVNGGYVIQQCMKLFSPALTKFILDEVAENCVDISTDRSGCSVVQKCLGHAEGEAVSRLVEEIISNAVVLAEDPYGNYVVQYLVKMKISQINALIVRQLLGKYVQLSMNKHASNVVEDLLELSEEKYAAIIVLEIMDSLEFLNVLQDPYGNYVAQRALKISKGPLHKRLSNRILSNYGNLHSHLYGKRVLSFAKGCKIRV